jgi:hypothetical protein
MKVILISRVCDQLATSTVLVAKEAIKQQDEISGEPRDGMVIAGMLAERRRDEPSQVLELNRRSLH